MAHKDVRIELSITGEIENGKIETRHYVAVGFLEDDEKQIDSSEIFARVPNAIGEEDADFLSKHFSQFPKILGDYRLLTGQSQSGNRKRFRCFEYQPEPFSTINYKWREFWNFAGWFSSSLVICRVS